MPGRRHTETPEGRDKVANRYPLGMGKRRSWGSLRTQRSGRVQASYVSPIDGQRYYGPRNYDNEMDAEAWLREERRLIELDAWVPPPERQRRALSASVTVEQHIRGWLYQRDLAESTRDLYSGHAERRIYPALGERLVADLTPADIRAWWAGMGRKHPTARRHAYNVLRSALNTAVEDGILGENPCRIDQKPPEERDVESITPEELDQVAAEVHPHYRVAVYILAWTSLRFGELIEIRRKDISDGGGVMKLRVRRGATRVGKRMVVGDTKTARSKRPVTVPPHVAEMIREHLKTAGRGPESLLVTTTQGNRLSKSAFTRSLKKGYRKINRPELRIHDLRAVGATYAAQAGATTKELMTRLGHTTPRMAMKYQLASEARDEEIARRMTELTQKSPPRSA